MLPLLKKQKHVLTAVTYLLVASFLNVQIGWAQDLQLLNQPAPASASENQAAVQALDPNAETSEQTAMLAEKRLPNPMDFLNPSALSPVEENALQNVSALKADAEKNDEAADEFENLGGNNQYDYERYEFEDALDLLRPEYASAVVVKSISREDIKKLTELSFETAIVLLHGEIVLFTSGNQDGINLSQPARGLLAQASFVSHVHTAREIQEGPSTFDLREAVEAPALEYVVTGAGFYAYNQNGVMNETPYSLEEFAALLQKAAAKARENQDQVAARSMLNEFIRQMDLYNENPAEGFVFRKGGVVADLIASANISMDNGTGSNITGGLDGSGGYHFQGTRVGYADTLFSQTQTLGVQATQLRIKYKSTTAIGSGTVSLTTASGNYSADTFFQNTNGAEQTLLLELPHDFSLVAGDLLKIHTVGDGQVSMTFTEIVYIDNVRPLATVQLKLGSAASEVTQVREVTLATTDINGNRIADMRVSMDNGRTWTAWESFQTSKRILLPEGEGLKGVLVETRDASGNTYRTSDTITFRAIPANVPTQAVTGNIFTNASSVSTLTNGSNPIANQGYTSEGWYFFNGTRRLGTDTAWVQSQPLNASGKALRIRYKSSTLIGWSTIQMGGWSQNVFLYNTGGLDDEVDVYLPLDSALSNVTQFKLITSGPDGNIDLTLKEITLAGVSLVTPLVTTNPGLPSLQFYRNGAFETQNLSRPLVDGNNHFDFTFGAQAYSVDLKLKGIDLVTANKPKPSYFGPYDPWPHSWTNGGTINGAVTMLEYDQPIDLRNKVIRITYPARGQDTLFTLAFNESSRSDTTFYANGSEYVRQLPGTSDLNSVTTIRLDSTCHSVIPCAVAKVELYDSVPFGGSIVITRAETSLLYITSPAQLTVTRNQISSNDTMSFSVNGGAWSTPVPFQNNWTLDLPGDNGKREIRYKLTNQWGQESISKDIVFVDNTVPVGTMKINGGAAYAYDRTVTLTLEGFDGGSGLYQMQFSQDEGQTWTNWEAYSPTKQLTLTGDDGLKIIYARYRDKAGNVMPLEQPVILSTPLPFNGWAMKIEDKTGIFSYDILFRRFSESNFTVVQSDFPVSGTGITTWVDDGSVTHHDSGIFAVRVNRRATPIVARITLDTVAPSGAVIITNNNGNYLASLAQGETAHHVQLDLSSVRDRNNQAPLLMQFKTDASTPWDENWEDFHDSKTLDLQPGGGKRTIYARVKDSNNHISEFTDFIYGTISDYLSEVDLGFFSNTGTVEPFFGFPFDRYTQKNDTQPTHLGFYALLLANIASGQIVTDKISKESAIAGLDYMVKNLLSFQSNQYNASTNPNGMTYKGLLPWFDFDSATGTWRRKVDNVFHRGDTIDVRDNANLTTAFAAAIGALADVQGTAAQRIRNNMDAFINNQRAGYESLFASTTQGEFLMRNYDFVRNVFDSNPYDYFGDEFRSAILFVALRYSLPIDVYSFLKLNMRKYTAQDGDETYAASPYHGGSFQMLWPLLTMPEKNNPRLREMLQNFVSLALEFAHRTDQPNRPELLQGFLAAAYELQGFQIIYNGNIGINQIKSAPETMDQIAPSLYTLGAAHEIAPAEINQFLEAIITTHPQLVTSHGLWEGYDHNEEAVVQQQVSSNIMTFILGMAGTGAANMERYLADHQLDLSDAQPIAADSDIIATANEYVTTPVRDPKDGFTFGTGTCGDTTDTEPNSGAFRVQYTWSNSTCTVGVGFRHEVTPLDASGQHLRISYKSGSSLDLSGASLEFKHYWAYPDDSAGKTHIKLNIKDLKFKRTSACLPGSTGCEAEVIDIDLPATISFNDIHQVTLVIPPQAAGQSMDLEITDLDLNYNELSGGGGGGGGERFSLGADAKGPALLAVINHGDLISQSSTVTLDVLAHDDSGIDQYRIIRNENDDPKWEDFVPTQEITFDGTEGVKTFLYQIRDMAGNITEKNVSILIDHTAPAVNPRIKKDSGDAINQETVLLELQAEDPLAGVSQMRFSEDGVMWREEDWEDYAPAKEFQFTGDGPKQIFFQVKDRAGNIAEGSKSFTLDTVPPAISISLPGNVTITNSRDIVVNLTANDPGGSGVDWVRYSPNDEWERYSPTRKITLEEGDGPKTLVYQVLDKAGNFTEATQQITLDTSVPVLNGIQLAFGEDYATENRVTVNLNYEEEPGLEYHYEIDNEKGWSDDWQPVDPDGERPQILFTSEGPKTVRFRLRDAAGNLSVIVTDTIIVDTQSPTAQLEINGGAAYTSSKWIDLNIQSGDGAGSGTASMRFSVNGKWGGWMNYSSAYELNLADFGEAFNGGKEIHVEVKDHAGLISQEAIASITFDRTRPTPVSTLPALQKMKTDGNYYLTADMDAQLIANWKPIGTRNAGFRGAFDGNGFTIRNLTMNRPNEDYVGLFGSVEESGTIKNMKLENVSIKGRSNVGAITGYLFLATIANSSAEGGTVTGVDRVGGLIGESYNGNGVSQSHSNIIVQGNGQVGGIVGKLWDGNLNNLDQTYALGTVTGVGAVGGLAGYSKSGDLIRSYATGNITGTDNVGGLVGQTTENAGIKDSYYAVGRVAGITNNVGGIAGYYDSYDDGISNTYFAGTVTNVTPSHPVNTAGGFLGTYNRARSISNNHWDVQLNPGLQDTVNRGDIAGITSHDTAAMKNKSTYAGWDFVHTWYMEGYPRLGEDKTPPVGTLLVNSGAEYTNNTNLSLSFNASEEIQYFDYSVDGGDWIRQSFQDPAAISISNAEGEREIRVKLFDLAENQSEIYTDRIKLDLTPPRVMFDLGESLVSFAQYIILSTEDPVESLDKICLTEAADAEGNPVFAENCGQLYFQQVRWTFSSGYGTKKLFLRTRDKAGNESIFSDEVRIVDNNLQADASLKAKDITQFSLPEQANFLGIRDGRMITSVLGSNTDIYAGIYSSPLSPLDLSQTGDEWIFGLASPQTGSNSVNLYLSSATGFASFNLHSLSQGENIYAISKAKILEQALNFDFLNVYSITFQAFPNTGIPGRMVFYFQPDRTPPIGSVVINNGNAYTTSAGVTLSLDAQDTTLGASESGVSDMRLSFDGTFAECENNPENEECWQTFSQTQNLALPAGDGVKTVYYQLRDKAGNLSTVFQNTIILDTTIPSGSILVKNGASYTTSAVVTLTLTGTDETSGVSEMNIWDGEKWLGWESFSTSKTITLPGGDGDKNLKFKVRDRAFLESAEIKAPVIVLDRKKPVVTALSINGGSAYTNSRTATLTLGAADDTSGVVKMEIFDGEKWLAIENFATSKTITLMPVADGTKTVRVRVTDHAGLVSAEASASILLDTTPPVAAITSARPFTRDRFVSPVFSPQDFGSGFQDRRFLDVPGAAGDWTSALSGVPVRLGGLEGLKTLRAEIRDKAGNTSIVTFSIYYGVAPYLASLKPEPASVPAVKDMVKYLREDLVVLTNSPNHDKWVKEANKIADAILKLPVYEPNKPAKKKIYENAFYDILKSINDLYAAMPVF